MKLRNILNWIIPLSFLLAACTPANKKETGKLIQLTRGENDCVQFYFNQSLKEILYFMPVQTAPV